MVWAFLKTVCWGWAGAQYFWTGLCAASATKTPTQINLCALLTEISLYGFSVIWASKLVFIPSGWSAFMQIQSYNPTWCPRKECVCVCCHKHNTIIAMMLIKFHRRCDWVWHNGELLPAFFPALPQILSGDHAAHVLHRGPDPARSGQVSGRAETKPHGGAPLER